nr:unnamed protein product [Callosobruchus chinensis]CAH7747782.1 unnamed protein product [Callosobruchus chinensis]
MSSDCMPKPEEKNHNDSQTICFEGSSHQSSLLGGLNSLREKGELLDITLVVEGRVFRAHKAVLAACSDYFRAMFTDSMLEARQNEICLNGITATGFQQILEYAYTSRIKMNLANVQDVLDTASHVQMVDIIQACTGYLQSQIDIDNCVDIATIAERYSLSFLLLRVYRFMSRHLLEFSNSTEFYRLTAQQLEKLLAYDFPVDCSEADVLSIVLRWIFHVESNELDVRLDYAFRMMRYVHFKEISRKKLDSILNKLEEDRRCDWELYKIILQQSTRDCGKYGLNSDLLNSRGMELALLKIGGFGVCGITNEITYCFSLGNKWKHLTSIPHVEQCNFGTAVLNNELYVVGGCFNQALQENIHPFGFKYSPGYNEWYTIAPMTTERCRFTLTVLDGALFAIGGVSEEDECIFTSECEYYEPRDDHWYSMESLPVDLSQHAAAAIDGRFSKRGRLFISGGISPEGVQNQVYSYDLATSKWSRRAPMLTPRADHVMVTIGDKLYVCGGWTEDEEFRRNLVETIDVYDVEQDCWQEVTKVPNPRYHAGITAVDRTIYFVGGFHNDAMFDRRTMAIEHYDIDRDRWTTEEKYPQRVWEHTCATLYVPRWRTEDMEVIADEPNSA